MSNLFKSKFFLGTLVVAFMFVAGFALNAPTASADCSITVTLKVGSKGAEVSCLQAIVGATADGSFGPKTKTAVMAWQSGHGLTADGVVGPKTRAALSGAPMSGGFPAGCSSTSGYSTSTGLPCNTGGAGLPAGCTSTSGFSPTSGAKCDGGTGGVVSGLEGSATIDYEAIPASGVSIYTGASKTPGVTFKVKATGSNIVVNSLSLDVNERIWLDASAAYLMDGSTVLATVPLSASTVQEVTTGSIWRIQFSGFSATALVGTNKDLTVAFDRPTVTQNNNTTVQIQTTSYIRTTDGSGFTNTVSPIGTRIMSFSPSAATQGTLTTSLSSVSPLSQSNSGLSTTVSVLTPVHLMDFDLKGTNSPITVTNLYGTAVAGGGATLTNEVASFELRDGSTVLSSVTGAATNTFASLNVVVPQNGTKTLSIWAQMNPIAATDTASHTISGGSVTFTMVPLAHTTAYDANFNTVTDTTATVAGNTQYMYQYAPSIVMGTTTANTTNTSGVISADFSLPFTVTAPSGQTIYVAKAIAASGSDNIVVKTTPVNGGTVSDTMTASSTSGTDTTNYYIVLAGQSRTFTAYSHVPNGGSAGYTGVSLTKVHWNVDGEANAAPVAQTWGLNNFNTASVYVTT